MNKRNDFIIIIIIIVHVSTQIIRSWTESCCKIIN